MNRREVEIEVGQPEGWCARRMKELKKGVLSAARALSGFRRVADSEWRRRRLGILCYHGVAQEDEDQWNPEYFVSAERLEERFRFLRDNGYRVLPLDRALDQLRCGALPPRSVSITFDDGGSDFYHRAWPLLKRFGYPATVYLTTFYVQHRRPVFGMFCGYLLWKVRSSGSGGGDGSDIRAKLGTAARRETLQEAIVRAAAEQRWPQTKKDDFAEGLAGQLGIDYEAMVQKRILQLMTPAEVAELAASGIDIQLHTHRHRTPRNKELFQREIRDNRAAIQQLAGGDVPRHFCYPSGVVEAEFLPWLEEEGVLSATTCESGLAGSNTHPLLLPRIIDTMNLSAVEFEGWISGAMDHIGTFLRRRRHRIQLSCK
jgi:peptidoglycan/xylan/chitin deacetylase (PgdA/CDA1 family)